MNRRCGPKREVPEGKWAKADRSEIPTERMKKDDSTGPAKAKKPEKVLGQQKRSHAASQSTEMAPEEINERKPKEKNGKPCQVNG